MKAMSNALTEEKIKAASDTIDAFLDSLSAADEKKQRRALSKYIGFLFDAQAKISLSTVEMILAEMNLIKKNMTTAGQDDGQKVQD